jgi:hypothetical protein
MQSLCPSRRLKRLLTVYFIPRFMPRRLDIHQIGQGCVAPQDSIEYATSVDVLYGSGKVHPEEYSDPLF